MSSTNKTTYYDLPQFVDNDIFNPLVDDNDAYSKIDTALHNIANAEADDASDIVGIKSRLDSAEGDIDALEAQNGDNVLTTTAQTLSGAVNELDADVSALDGRLDIVEDDINNASTGLKAKVSALETQNGNNALITVAQTLSGAVNELAKKFITPQMYGAVADGVHDDTLAIQTAINSNDCDVIYFPKGTYLIDGEGSSGARETGVTLRSNIILILDNDATLKHKATSADYYNVINIPASASNIRITGGVIDGNRSEHTGDTGEWGYGIFLKGDNVVVDGVNVVNCWGDGICVSEATHVKIVNCKIDGNRRQGITVGTNCDDVIIAHNTIINTNGTAPQAGIDVEPDWGYTKNITITDNYFHGNTGCSVSLYGGQGGGIIVSECIISNNIMDEAFNTIQTLFIGSCKDVKAFGNIIKTANTVAGVQVQNSENVSVTDNFIMAGNYIQMYYSKDCRMNNNTIIATHGDTVISAFYAVDCEFNGNTIERKFEGAVVSESHTIINFYTVVGDTTHVTNRCTFNNNKIKGVVSQQAITISNGGHHITIKDNVVEGEMAKFCNLINAGEYINVIDNILITAAGEILSNQTSNDIVDGNINGTSSPKLVTQQITFTLPAITAGSHEDVTILATDAALAGYKLIGIVGYYVPRPGIHCSQMRVRESGNIDLTFGNNSSVNVGTVDSYLYTLYMPKI